MKKIAINLFVFLFSVAYCFSQEKPRFYDDVQTIKNYDKIYTPSENPILFIGSSSIRKWGSLQTTFGNYNVLNRGIGGAVIDDITYYLDDLVFIYKPRQIFIYVGENDIPIKEESPQVILEKTINLYRAIRSKLPLTPIVYISLKPSPVREKFMDKCIEANHLIKDFLRAEKNASFVDVFTSMVSKGKSRPELFLADMLHMKPNGYRIWEEAIKKQLLKPTK